MILSLLNIQSSYIFLLVIIINYICGISSSSSNTIKYLKLKHIPCSGSYQPGGVYSEYIRAMRLKSRVEIEDGYVKADREPVASFYLAPDKLVTETIPSSTDKCILRSIIPVPVRSRFRDDIVSSIMSAMETNPSDNPEFTSLYSWNGGIITDRDRGFLDNLSRVISKWLKHIKNISDFKKLMFEGLRLRNNSLSPYHSLVKNLDSIAGLKVTGLIIEVADSPDELTLSLGAAVLLSKRETANQWKLTSKTYKTLIRQERVSQDAKIIDCYMDEVYGLHLATGLPIYAASTLYDRVAVDGILEKSENDDSVSISAPYFDSVRESVSWNKQLEEYRAKPAKVVPKVNQIVDATSFFKMRTSEKRACLRASGIFNLPRPREGPKMVDSVMIPLLDEDVAYEVLRRLGETGGNYELAAKMEDFETRKPLLARLYNEANRNGDRKRAKEIIDEMNSIAFLYYDPSRPDEVITEGFDIEEWYWDQRRRMLFAPLQF